MKVLFVSNLFPDASDPNRGRDNATLLKYLARHCEVRVLALRPTPGVGLLSSKKQFSPRADDEQFAPVFASTDYVPKIGSRFNHRLMANSIRGPLKKIRETFPFDALLVSWIFPDACAIAQLSRELEFPFVAIAQGSDVHQYLKIPARRKIILSEMPRVSGIITRSGELARLLAEAGLDKEKLHVVYNGTEPEIFRPADRNAARRALNLPADCSILLFVGNLLPIKNPLLLVSAHAELCRRESKRDIRLLFVGSGSLAEKIRSHAAASGFGQRVELLGQKTPGDVAQLMQASDLFCMSSDNEGVPNVILEALACGLPVVSTRVGGIHEIISSDSLGRLVEKGNVTALTNALAELLLHPLSTDGILKHAAQYSWPQTANAYLQILEMASRFKK